jgi:hypothetical protein
VGRFLKAVVQAIAAWLPIASICRLLDRARRSSAIPIVVAIDVEPDVRLVDRRDPGPWRGFEEFVERIPALRERLSELTGAPVAFTWCLRMDPQVAETWGSPAWVAEAYRGVFAELERSGDELGLHTHLWRWSHETDEWVTDHDPVWGSRCVTMALDAFRRAFGRSCPVHRGGDRCLSAEMLACLDEGGVKVDLSVEPGIAGVAALGEGERVGGLPPDYRGVPTEPYRSSPGAFPAPDPANRSDPLLIPLLTGPALKGGWDRTIVLGAHSGLFALRLAAELLRGRPPVLAFALRTDPAQIRAWRTTVENLQHLGRHRGARFVTASAAADGLAAPVA